MSTDAPTQKFIEALKAQQERSKLRDVDFARRLGITHSMWSRVKRGQRGVGIQLASQAMHAFSDLAPAAFSFLSEKGTIGNSEADNSPVSVERN